MKRKTIKVILGLILAFLLLSLAAFRFLNVSLDYWIWLGCPNPIGMLFIEDYPGHDLTAEYRHEDYFVKIPNLYTYNQMISKFGEPKEIIEMGDEDIFRFKAVYNEFYAICFGKDKEVINNYNIGSVVVTSDKITFMRDKIKVGDNKEKVIKSYRYYDKITGFDDGDGYIDGSMLTGQTWIEFSYDENNCVSTIEVYSPY